MVELRVSEELRRKYNNNINNINNNNNNNKHRRSMVAEDLPIHIRNQVIQGDQLYMSVCFWYLVNSDWFSLRGYSTRQLTIYKVPTKHGNVYLVRLYYTYCMNLIDKTRGFKGFCMRKHIFGRNFVSIYILFRKTLQIELAKLGSKFTNFDQI